LISMAMDDQNLRDRRFTFCPSMTPWCRPPARLGFKLPGVVGGKVSKIALIGS
jgi:hypothetical protein